MSNKIFLRNVSYLLNEHDMSKADLARRIGVTQGTITQWYNGMTFPTRKRQEKIAEVFGVTVGSLKTQNSNRIVPLLAPLKLLLMDQKRQNASFFIVWGAVPLSASQLNVQWVKFFKAHGCATAYRKRDGNYTHQAWKADTDRHQLRHAYATILWESGIDVKTAQHLLGHANFSTTMDIYTHWKESAVGTAKDRLNDYFKAKQ